MSPETKFWVDLASQIGIPGLIVTSLIAFGWRSLPFLIKWWQESARQAQIVSEAIPRMEQSLHQMATDGNALLREINAKIDILIDRGA